MPRPSALALVLLLASPAAADTARRPPATELQSAIYAARDAVLPALVHVEPIVDVFQRGQKTKAAVTGSGFIVDAAGHVVTNYHVVENARRVTCILQDRREVQARVVGTDPFTDIAVLQLDADATGRAWPVAKLGTSADLQAGQHVVAMGSPLGLARSISVGVVSTPDRYFPEDVLPSGGETGEYNTWIQTDAAINPGNSGGPLVDLSGRVIGVNARAIPVFGENLGFAIPIDVAKEVATQLIADGRVHRSWIGVTWQHLKSLAGFLGAEGRGGVIVGSVVSGGPAARAGLAAGDVLVQWNGEPVEARFEEELPAFRKRVADTPVGLDVPVVLLREGREVRAVVTTAEHPATETDEVEIEAWGVTVRDLTPELARRRRIKDLEGVLVTGVKPAAPASVGGLESGDILRLVRGERVKSVADLQAAVARAKADGARQVLLKADRGTTIRVVLLELGKG